MVVADIVCASKANPNAGKDLEAYLVALLHRWLELSGGQNHNEAEAKSAGDRLERLLPRLLNLPQIVDLARDLNPRLAGANEDRWEQGVAEVLEYAWKAMAADQGWKFTATEPAPEARVRCVLDIYGWPDDLAGFAQWIRDIFSELLDKVASGTPVTMDYIQGLFTTERDRSLNIMARWLLAWGGQLTAEAVSQATQELALKLASPELAGGVEAMETAHHLAENSPDDWFPAVWSDLGSRTMGRIRGRCLALPGERYFAKHDQRDWSEEMVLAQASIFADLNRRGATDPLGLLGDALAGKLAPSMLKAEENDLLDLIRGAHAKKRDDRAVEVE